MNFIVSAALIFLFLAAALELCRQARKPAPDLDELRSERRWAGALGALALITAVMRWSDADYVFMAIGLLDTVMCAGLFFVCAEQLRRLDVPVDDLIVEEQS